MTAQRHTKIISADFPWSGRDFQINFLSALATKKNLLLIAPRQHGKSEVAIRILITLALADRSQSTHVYVAPFISQARKVIWDRLLSALNPIRDHCEIRVADLIVKLPNGARIMLAGGDNEGYRGTSARTLIIDEADSFDEAILNGVILPSTVAHKEHARVIWIGTLGGGYSRLWNLYEKNRRNPIWHCQLVKASEVKFMSEEELAAKREELGESAFLREFECDPFAPSQTAVLGDLVVRAEREGRVLDFPANPSAKVYTSWDLGVRDATSIWFFQLIGDWVNFIAYREYTNMGLDKMLPAIQREFEHWHFGTTILPHDLKQREATTAQVRWRIFEDLHFGDDHHILSNIPVVETIASTRMNMFRARFNKAECKLGIERLRAAEYVKDGKTDTVQNKIRHDDASHGFDAFRYGMHYIEVENPVFCGSSFNRTYRKPKVLRSC